MTLAVPGALSPNNKFRSPCTKHMLFVFLKHGCYTEGTIAHNADKHGMFGTYLTTLIETWYTVGPWPSESSGRFRENATIVLLNNALFSLWRRGELSVSVLEKFEWVQNPLGTIQRDVTDM